MTTAPARAKPIVLFPSLAGSSLVIHKSDAEYSNAGMAGETFKEACDRDDFVQEGLPEQQLWLEIPLLGACKNPIAQKVKEGKGGASLDSMEFWERETIPKSSTNPKDTYSSKNVFIEHMRNDYCHAGDHDGVKVRAKKGLDACDWLVDQDSLLGGMGGYAGAGVIFGDVIESLKGNPANWEHVEGDLVQRPRYVEYADKGDAEYTGFGPNTMAEKSWIMNDVKDVRLAYDDPVANSILPGELPTVRRASDGNMLAAPYDWRTQPDIMESRDGLFSTLCEKIERMVQANNGTKCALIGFSMGSKVGKYFIHFAAAVKGTTWVNQNIDHFIPMCGPWLGSVKMTRTVLDGDFPDLAALVDPTDTKSFFR